MLRHGLSLIIIGFRIQLAQAQAVVEATPFGAILHPSGQFYITKGLHMNGIKNALALVVVIGVSVVGLATCSGGAHAGEAEFAVHFEGLKASHDIKWELTCIDKCEGGTAEAERLANTPSRGVAKFGRNLSRGVWQLKVTTKVQPQSVLPKQPEACTASLRFTTCYKGEHCAQSHTFVCPTDGGKMRQ